MYIIYCMIIQYYTVCVTRVSSSLPCTEKKKLASATVVRCHQAFPGIVTIQGTPEQIEVALREVIRIVHRSQELDDTEDGIFART